VGRGVVLAESVDDFIESNTYGTRNGNLTCQFANIAGMCVPYSGEQCALYSVETNTTDTTHKTSYSAVVEFRLALFGMFVSALMQII
jgi:hypothetical protein